MRPSTLESEPTVLIVDDHPANLELLSTFLELNGFAVRASTSAAEAIRSADLDPPSLILMDVNMPGINGFEACRILKENENTEATPIIFISADDSAEQRRLGFQCGAADYVVAPFVLEEIEARICSRLEVEELRKRDRERAIAFESLLREQIMLDRQQQYITKLLVHDMTNPLQEVMEMLELMKSALASDEPIEHDGVADRIESGVDACQRMAQMVKRLPEQRRQLSDALAVSKHVTRFSIIARAARAMLSDVNNVYFDVGDDCDVWCDKSIISRVVVNLVNNALKHGGPGTQVIVNCIADDLQTTFEVSDNGKGVAGDDVQQLLPSYNLDETGRSREYNLGLAFCRLAIDGHQGTIEVESRPGQGTKFTIQLPNNFELEPDDIAGTELADLVGLDLTDETFSSFESNGLVSQ